MTRDGRCSGGSFSPAARGLSRTAGSSTSEGRSPQRRDKYKARPFKFDSGRARPGSVRAFRGAGLTGIGGDATMPTVLLRRVVLLVALPLALAGCGASERPNIVLIILDTARAD